MIARRNSCGSVGKAEPELEIHANVNRDYRGGFMHRGDFMPGGDSGARLEISTGITRQFVSHFGSGQEFGLGTILYQFFPSAGWPGFACDHRHGNHIAHAIAPRIKTG